MKGRLGLAASLIAFSIGWTARTPSSATAPAPASREDGLAAFETVKAVLQHPRCQNCHIPGDAPLQFDQGLPHAQNVRRGPDGNGSPGLTCATCHGAANPPTAWGEHMPPGAPSWKLPPPGHKMVFIGLSSGALCRLVKDPAKNGGRNFEALIRHVSEDALVGWGWSPGVGRAPVPIPRDEFVARFKDWIGAGAPCAP
ncbi:MAG TPA: hypothetical protein VKG01_13185 [Thermoanaerobaculia bacterium]|nr:hypothetical protein [Thermoanaerobaculia bacterium]